MKRRCWVVKVGSSSITNSGISLAEENISAWSQDIAELRAQGVDCVVVSSGAIAAGMAHLGLSERPGSVAEKQAVAAIGQMDLVQVWRDHFQQHSLVTGQVLLNHADITNRERYLNARSTLKHMLKLPAIPIVNENDSVATDEIRLGDNDNLAALVANLMDAEGLLLLTDQAGVYSANPNTNPDAQLIRTALVDDPMLLEVASGAESAVGTGGMATKIKAARAAARSGADTVIASAIEPNVISRVVNGELLGTRLTAHHSPIRARKQWIVGRLRVTGQLVVDAGAEARIIEDGVSLLPIGIVATSGHFDRGDCVEVLSMSGMCLARGLVNFDARELSRIKGLRSVELEVELGYQADVEAIHRDNLVLL